MKSITSAAAVLSLWAVSAAAHGNITSPPARLTGPAMVAACGQTAVNAVLKDGNIPLEDVLQPAAGCRCPLSPGLSPLFLSRPLTTRPT